MCLIQSVCGANGGMLSIVVNFFNNRREAENTLYSLTRGYQKDLGDVPYEVVPIDNGSTQPLSEERVRSFGPEFRYRFVDTDSVSPVRAINSSCRDALGEELLVVIDGAHILSPGILRGAADAFSIFKSPLLATVPFHLGPARQNISVSQGYNQIVEDRLLSESGWRLDGYRLCNIAGGFADASGGWFGCLFESGCLGLRKTDYFALGGFDERFQSRGGGMVNLDFFAQAVTLKSLDYVMLLGEGTFHQFHGGVASNAPAANHPFEEFHREYMQIRGKPYERVLRRPCYLGALRNEALRIAKKSMDLAEPFW